MTQESARNMGWALWEVTKAGLMLTGLLAVFTWLSADTLGVAPVQGARAGAQDARAAALGHGAALFGAMRPESISAGTAALADGDGKRDVAGSEHSRVADYLARKYRVALDSTRSIVASAYVSARDLGVDPALVLAVMGIESRMNPLAASPMGAVGLMQIIPRFHADKLEDVGGMAAALDPAANIRVGTMILKDYLQRFGGVEAGLKAYSGATGDDFGYAAKVLAERDRIKAVANGNKVAPAAVPVRLPASPPSGEQAAPQGAPEPTVRLGCDPQNPLACPSLRESDAAT
ncbi:MAG: transglycosylase SLT domain-containing protein [Burkholderiales bacterium]|nr:transglycosylase SLT domain-containing protein [Burkholderiales bacterium]